MRINLRNIVIAAASVGSLGLAGCEMSRHDAPVTKEAPVEAPPLKREPVAPKPEPPAGVGGGPTTMVDQGTARGMAAVEQYLDGKGTGDKRFALDGLTYEAGCPYLKQDGVDAVDTLADALKKHPETKVTIEGFTDNSGSAEANEYISRTRAEFTEKQLVMCGIDKSRIEIAGRGTENPIASNDSDDGKAQNRRAEVVIHK
jgi:K(+)-stimulated pyrophosphate-energized sodium pump